MTRRDRFLLLRSVDISSFSTNQTTRSLEPQPFSPVPTTPHHPSLFFQKRGPGGCIDPPSLMREILTRRRVRFDSRSKCGLTLGTSLPSSGRHSLFEAFSSDALDVSLVEDFFADIGSRYPAKGLLQRFRPIFNIPIPSSSFSVLQKRFCAPLPCSLTKAPPLLGGEYLNRTPYFLNSHHSKTPRPEVFGSLPPHYSCNL